MKVAVLSGIIALKTSLQIISISPLMNVESSWSKCLICRENHNAADNCSSAERNKVPSSFMNMSLYYDILCKYISLLLQEESFFNSAFG